MHCRHTRRPRPTSFTLVELLTVIAIIAILAGLILYAASGVMNQSARSRARTEIAGLSAAMEAYKADNGIYPTFPNGQSSLFAGSTNSYATSPATPGGAYENSSELLYQSLAGMTNVTDVPLPGSRSYFPFKKTQLAVDSSGSGNLYYIKDPFGNSYGYYNGTAFPPVNGTNAFDLWSTAGDMAGTNQPGWISNWGS